MTEKVSSVKIIKIISLTNNLVLISQIEEVGADIGEPDCKFINPFVIKSGRMLEPFLCEYTKQNEFMMSSDKILTLAEPTMQILDSYKGLV